MNDRKFLIWLHERLEHFHDENPLLDYMHKLRSIISEYPAEKTSKSESYNSLEECLKDTKQKPDFCTECGSEDGIMEHCENMWCCDCCGHIYGV